MKVIYATDGFEPALNAGALLEKIGNRDRIDVTVMSVTHAGIPAPKHMPIMLDPLPSRRADSLKIVDGAVEKLWLRASKRAVTPSRAIPARRSCVSSKRTGTT
jgi:hypothetical protein